MQLSESIQLRLITINDLDDLHRLMYRIYPATYAHLWEDGGKWYVDNTFNQTILQKELEEQDCPYYFVYFEKELVGILRLNLGLTLKVFPEKKASKLHRVYLDTNVHGRGIGKMLMDFSLEQAQAYGSEILWLEAMDTQIQALNFYKKYNFETAEPFRLTFELMYTEKRGMYRMWREV